MAGRPLRRARLAAPRRNPSGWYIVAPDDDAPRKWAVLQDVGSKAEGMEWLEAECGPDCRLVKLPGRVDVLGAPIALPKGVTRYAAALANPRRRAHSNRKRNPPLSPARAKAAADWAARVQAEEDARIAEDQRRLTRPRTAPADAHPAYRGSEHVDYDWWLERFAPPEVRREMAEKAAAARQQFLLERSRNLTAEDRRMMATERAEEARYGRRMRSGFRRENPVIRALRATLAERVADAKREILADVKAGHVPRTVRSFAKLHDYVDANGYGGWLNGDPKWRFRSEVDIPMANAVSDALDAWIKAGGLRGKS